MKIYFTTLILCAILCLNLSCDDLEYKYADKKDTISCNKKSINTKLLKEAHYSFENDLETLYLKRFKYLDRVYINYVNVAMTGNIPHEKMVSDYSRKVFEVLKKDKNLWVIKNGKHQFNYKSDLMNCIVENISDKDLQTTFKALLSTNSMNSKLIGSAIQSKMNETVTDKYLSTFIALDMYYARLFETKFTDSK